ncbi:MAG: hypothetical protein K4571_02065 [Deltaproteobacteria bacterium]
MMQLQELGMPFEHSELYHRVNRAMRLSTSLRPGSKRLNGTGKDAGKMGLGKVVVRRLAFLERHHFAQGERKATFA